MKTIQAVARYLPEKCGGIQIRLSELLPVLQAYGVESKIAAAQDGKHENTYIHNGIEVYRYPVFPQPKAEPNHGELLHGRFEYFERWLKEQKADIYHQHQWTPKCGLPHLRLAKELGMVTVVSIRLPNPVCQRETLMLNGQEVCDGKIDEVRCSHCCGVPSVISDSAIKKLAHTPLSISNIASKILHQFRKVPAPINNAATALLTPVSLPAYIAARRQGLLEMAKFADCIVTLSDRLYETLLLNDVPQEKLIICKTGVPDVFITSTQNVKKVANKALRVVFLGRWNRNKGIHILVEAIKSLPTELPIELTIYGSAVDDEKYREDIIQSIKDESRICVAETLTREELPFVLATYDILALPAQWFDVRPMSILEGYAAKLPVLGSDVGGVNELIKHNIDGLLLPPTDVKAWAEAFRQLSTNPNLLSKLRQGIQPIRTMSMEAIDTVNLYQSILEEKASQAKSSVSDRLNFTQVVGTM
ncbi:glycosyltransferase [Chroogloeocystis siderophila]|uniref:Group 1 glycosyl transferase n=1 Tax=Chroogloeocystis siderophila 5.2 s.c.1 TaxID=247279 RepID=A0A1U7HZ05_9CHRO|nr:glycosyltransferase [Chroogloeocystis siderophila]OKH28820.1 group 1 glycosyl transferase [Chroogloeocystis siderophila 5.2 s.c.1]